ncbi:hypothetical protein Tco_0903936, partial [Tanacetum coccineum]
MPYPSRRYGVSVPAFTKDHNGIKVNTPYPEKLNTPYPRYGSNIIFWKISSVVHTPRNPNTPGFPNQDMKEEFPGWFGSQIPQRYIDKDPVNGVRFVVHSRDERRTTQNSAICSPGEKDGEMYYGQLEEILEFSYMSFKFVLFRARGESFKDDQYILATQVKQAFYLEDMARRPPDWKVVQDVNHKKFSNGGVIVIEDDHDVIHFDNSSDLALSTSLDDLDFETLNIDGQSMDVDAQPGIIDVDEDDDLIDDEDTFPHDLADSDDEDLANDDDDGVAMSADVARGHGDDSGGDDRPPPGQIPIGCRGKGTRKPNRGGRKASRLDTPKQTRNL